ncbi:hypothetical protein HWV62_42769 [Athelia sp. TMB]|nr:hypothetical protein HWV62_42769 [Athelia sp. TMB]
MQAPTGTTLKSFKTALVTGAAQGIGRGIALRLSKDGLKVAINDLPAHSKLLDSLKSEIEANGTKCAIVVADVSDDTQVKSMVDQAVQELGSLDVMVANAGISLPAPLLQASVESWDTLFAVNARGAFLCYKYAALQMVAQGHGGRIIGASSYAGQRAEASLGAYSATKAAISSLTQSAAIELGAHGITVNAYAAGAIDTPMDMLAQMGMDPVAFRESEANKCVAKRFGTAEDIANLVSFLASPQSDFVTGK